MRHIGMRQTMLLLSSIHGSLRYAKASTDGFVSCKHSKRGTIMSARVTQMCILCLLMLGISSSATSQNESTAPEPITSEFTQFIPLPRESVYSIVADLENHPRLLPNVAGRIVVPRSEITQQAVAPNEIIAWSFVHEPANRLAVTRFRFFPPELIEEEMLTSPFADADILDVKKGKVKYIFEEAEGGTQFTAQSTFFPRTGRVYNREWIDGIWRQFLNNLQEMARSQ